MSYIEAKAKYGLDANKLTVLVIGGSLGARTINNSIAGGLERIAKDNNISLLCHFCEKTTDSKGLF